MAGMSWAEGLRTRTAAALAVGWSLFQLWYVSPLPFALGVLVINDGTARAIHLAFALALVFLAGGGREKTETATGGRLSWLFAGAGVATTLYLVAFDDALAVRAGLPNTVDLLIGALGLVLLLEATRRALGWPLVLIATAFLVYGLAGPVMPDVIAHKGASFSKTISHQWLSSEGVFGVALGVSTAFVFLFVLFGAFLERAGAGGYFIRLAFALLGHRRGGPAKAAVLASGLTGLASGSSIANVVTTGTFTVPLMKRVGFPAHKAAAVEVAASVNGQIMPPVMGAAAFLMVDYVGISYVEVLKHAILPAVISYAALFYLVHLEALKAGMTGLPRAIPAHPVRALAGFLFTFIAMALLALGVEAGLGWTRSAFGDGAGWVVAGLLGVVYLLFIRLAAPGARVGPAREESEDLEVVPPVLPTLMQGLPYLLPLVLLVWALVVERLSPGLAAFYAAAFLVFILLTQDVLLLRFRGEKSGWPELLAGARAALQGLRNGAEGMVGVALATATAGIIVGTVSLTGIGLVMTELVEALSGGDLVLLLIFTALISLVLGMGLPTTANYIVVATLMAPVIVALGGDAGLVVPVIAAHLFVFYFGLMADVTPPVGLASYAAAALAGADPLRTGFTAFFYSLRTAVLPFVFIFNPELLLIGITGWAHGFVVALAALSGMLIFAAATMGHFQTRNRLVETLLLLLAAFTLFRPDFWMDRIAPPAYLAPPKEITAAVRAVPEGGHLDLRVAGDTLSGKSVERLVAVRLGPRAAPDDGDGAARLAAAGLTLRRDEGVLRVERVVFGSAAHKAGLAAGWTVEGVIRPTDRVPKEVFYLPALLLAGGIWFVQRRRRQAEAK
ncbi:MAG: TRAP transporter permease [Alphaproteobacteria bacterium]